MLRLLSFLCLPWNDDEFLLIFMNPLEFRLEFILQACEGLLSFQGVSFCCGPNPALGIKNLEMLQIPCPGSELFAVILLLLNDVSLLRELFALDSVEGTHSISQSHGHL